MGQTRVDLAHILEDLRDAYSGPIEETILTEIVVNALDSGARSLALDVQRDERTLIARDDGRGMTRRELSRYHDLGASTKRRGRGIGYLSRHDGTLSEHERGLAISTLGEVSVRWAIWGRVSAAEHARGAHLRWTAAASLRRRRERHERNRPSSIDLQAAGAGQVNGPESVDTVNAPRVAGASTQCEPSAAEATPEPEATRTAATDVPLPTRGRIRKPATLSLHIRVEKQEDRLALARLVESTVWVSEAHPAYQRALASRAEACHIALAVASALAPLAAEPEGAQRFVSAFLARWGEAAANRRSR